MFADDPSRYIRLSRANGSTWNLDRRTFILVSVLALPVVLFCATYMTLFGIYEKLVYPSTLTLREVPEQWSHRAIYYNSIKNSNISHQFHINLQNSVKIEKYKLVCYYNFPHDSASLQVEELDAFLCTHINVAFAAVVNNSLYLNEFQQKILGKLVALKNVNVDLKILVSVGGAGGANGFPEMVLNHANRKSFIKSAFSYVKNFKIDGIDLDWEFPNEHPGKDLLQKVHFTQLLEELRHAINRHQMYKFLVSVAVAAPTTIVENSYDVPYMNDYVDFVNLMSYDYHYYTRVTPYTGLNSPLYASDTEKYYLATLNINYSSNFWDSLGMDRSKIIVGLPTYGHTFRLANIRNNGLYAPALGFGKLGTSGFADYAQICSFLSSNHISPVFDMETKSPYASKFTEWISFDDPQSLTYKAEYVRDKKFGGIMVYSLNADDYQGTCKAQRRDNEIFPLTKSIKRVLGEHVEP